MQKEKNVTKPRKEIYYTKTRVKITGLLEPYSVENRQKVKNSGIINLYLTDGKKDITKSDERRLFLQQQRKEAEKQNQIRNKNLILTKANYFINKLNTMYVDLTIKEQKSQNKT